MSRAAFLYALWCMGIAGLLLASGYYGWSPFADGGRAARTAGFYGPTHK